MSKREQQKSGAAEASPIAAAYGGIVRERSGPAGSDPPDAILVDSLDAAVDRWITGLYTFWGENTNPNGDPDCDNDPRVIPGSGIGHVTGACLRRRIRDVAAEISGWNLFIYRNAVLGRLVDAAAADAGIDKAKGKAAGDAAERLADEMRRRYPDVAAFGGVLTGEWNRGIIGALQIQHAFSHDPVVIWEHAVTRGAVASEEEAKSKNRTMGRSAFIRFGAYSAPFSVLPHYAKPRFTWRQLGQALQAMMLMGDMTQSSSRHLHVARLAMFVHDGPRVAVPEKVLMRILAPRRRDPERTPSSIDDYDLSVDRAAIPPGVRLVVVE
jgi:CRISPR-associated protein Csd2